MPSQPQTQTLSRPRCIRIAFLIDLDEDGQDVLDAIFRFSHSIWGGRFSLIVPCVNSAPVVDFLPWLVGFDPDVIYSYVDLSVETQRALHETVYPSVLQYHWRAGERRNANLDPSPSISPLTVGTLIPLAGAAGPFDGARGVRLIGEMGRTRRDRFLSDSFGTVPLPLRNALRGVLADAGSVVLVIEDDEFQPRQRHVFGSESTVPNANEALTMMAENRRILGVAQLSAWSTPRLDLRSHRWADSFNIVVGDTVADRILYWNARSLMAPWQDGSDVDLCIPRAKFADPAFVDSLRAFINRRNHTTGGSGPNRAVLRSISLGDDDLSGLTAEMRQGQIWVAYAHEHVADLAQCMPSQRDLEHAQFISGQHSLRSRKAWTETYSSGDDVRIAVPEPEHLRHLPTGFLDPSLGAWAIDLDLARAVDHSPYANTSHRWRLPRRLRVTSAFCQTYQLAHPHGEAVTPRVSANNFLTLYAAVGTSFPKISIPTDHDAIRIGLTRGRDCLPFHRFAGRDQPAQNCVEASRSGAGRYFWGVYQLFGSLNTARSVLLHAFWRKQFEDFGATDQRTDVRQERMTAKLLQRLGPHVLNLGDTSKLTTLADIVLQEADAVRATVRSLKWTKFEADFKVLAARYNEPDPAREPPGADQMEEERRWQLGALRDSVRELCRLNVLHQGYVHKCDRCLHRSWIAVADLKPQITCEVCHDVQTAPVDEPWQFRLHGFLREALQRYGVGPLFWVLSHFQQHSSSSFWFDGPLDVYFSQDAAEARSPETDIDLTMIDSGLVRMCEVKQSERQFQEPVALAQTMLRLRPDIAMIAVMEPESPGLRRKFEQFAAALRDSGIKPELLTFDAAREISSHPYF